MRRFLWATPLLFVLISSGARANSVSISLGVNNGLGYNFGFEEQSPGMTVFLDGGTNVFVFFIGYAPGTTLSAFAAPVYLDDGIAQIGGVDYPLNVTTTGSLFMSSFTLPTPTNGASNIAEPVVLTFTDSVTVAATGQIINLAGSQAGKITFFLDPDGLYYAGGFTTIPEPGTVGLMGTGLIGIFSVARRRLRIFMRLRPPRGLILSGAVVGSDTAAKARSCQG